MKFIIRKHWPGIAVAIAISIIIGAPPVVFHFSSGFKGIEMMKTNTETHYIGQVEEVLKGHYGLGNPYLNEGKNDPYLFPPLPAYIIAGVGKFLSLNAVHAVMILRFVFAFLFALCVYAFTYELTKNRTIACIAAPFAIVGYRLVEPSHWLEFIRLKPWPIGKPFLDYGRPITPSVSSLFLFSYLAVFWKALTEQKKTHIRVFSAVAALLLGLSFYVYLFTWTFLFCLNAFLVFFFVIAKDGKSVLRVIVISVAAGIIGIPYLLHTYAVSKFPTYAEVAPRFGFVHSHLAGVSILLIVAFFLFLFARRAFTREAQIFFAAFFCTAFAVTNEQVLTGVYLFNDHFHWYDNTPILIIFLSAAAWLFVEKIVKNENARRLWGGFLVLLLLAHGALTQYIAYGATAPAVAEEQRYAPFVAWLNAHTKKDATVFARIALSDMIPAVTHNAVYFTGSALYTLTPTKRMLQAYLAYAYLQNIPALGIREYLEFHRADISGFAYGYAYYFQKGVCTSCFPESVIDEMAEQYRHLNDGIFLELLRARHVDYIAWDRKLDPSWRINRWGLPQAAQFGDIVVYTVSKH